MTDRAKVNVHKLHNIDRISMLDNKCTELQFLLFVNRFYDLSFLLPCRQLKRQGRHERGHGLLKTLQDMYDGSSARSGKHKLSQEIRAAMDFYLVRQMVTLLKSTFAEGTDPLAHCAHRFQTNGTCRVDKATADIILCSKVSVF